MRGPDGAACFDIEGRLPGRGAWVCPSPGCLDAMAPGALGHVLRAPVRLPSPAVRRRELAEGLGRRVANLLTIARKMRGVTCGPAGVRAMLAAGRARLVLIAADISADAIASWTARSQPVALRTAPDAQTLGMILGRSPVEAAAITVDGLASAILQAMDRWQAFSSVSCDNERSGLTDHRIRRGEAPRREEVEGS